MEKYTTIKTENPNAIVFKKEGSQDYFMLDANQTTNKTTDFLAFCGGIVIPTFLKFKYGENFFNDVKEFHEDRNMLCYQENRPATTFKEDYEYYLTIAEQDFQTKLKDGRLYPAIVLKSGTSRWRKYNMFLNGKLPGRDNEHVKALLQSHDVAVFCQNPDDTLSLLHHYTKDLSYNILRGKGTIGNLIEVKYGPINLLLDCGKELDDEPETESELEKQVLSKSYDGILVSHYHLDHAGLIHKVHSPVYMGEGCFSVLNAQQKYNHTQPLKDVTIFRPNEEFSISKGNFEIKIRPILVDHSAYDSYMFLLTAHDKTLLYTGDFRSNGRKLFLGTLKQLPSRVDTLICEATNMFSERQNMTEQELETQATQLMSKYAHVFVLQAGTNIDRLVSFYKASRRNKKPFFMDTYVASITENLPNIPNVRSFRDVYCFWSVPSGKLKASAGKHAADWRLFQSYGKGLGSLDLGSPKNAVHGDLSEFTMLVRPSMLGYLKQINQDKERRFKTSIFKNSVLIYSLWQGYKEKEDVRNFLAEMEGLGVEIVDLHTSGHADKQTIDRLKQKVNPGVIEYVHYYDSQRGCKLV